MCCFASHLTTCTVGEGLGNAVRVCMRVCVRVHACVQIADPLKCMYIMLIIKI